MTLRINDSGLNIALRSVVIPLGFIKSLCLVPNTAALLQLVDFDKNTVSTI